MPMLPTNGDGSLFLGPVGAHATLTEADLDLESWNLEFLSLADRRPICAQMQWRQQGDGINSLARTTEVRFAPPYNAPDGPFEQHDMSRFATNERHAVKVGAYIVAHRALATHTLEVSARPGGYNTSVSDGSIVRVRVPRAVDGAELAYHDYLYRVASIGKDLQGETKFSLMHLPLDANGRSAISVAVANAQPSGILLTITPTGPVCDVNSSSNETPLGEDLYDWDLPLDNPFDSEIPFDQLPMDPMDGPPDEPFDEPPLDPPGPPLDPPGPPLDPPEPPGPPPEPPPGPDPGPDPVPPSPGQPLPPPGQPPADPPPDSDPDKPPTEPPAPPPPGQPDPGYPPFGPDGSSGPQWGPPGPPVPGVTWDIEFEQQMDIYYSEGLDLQGKVVSPSGTQPGGWAQYAFKNVSSWWHVAEGSTTLKFGSDALNDPDTLKIMGINAITKAAVPGTPDSKSASTSQGFMSNKFVSIGPWKTIVFSHQIRNFKIRRHGSGDPFEPGTPPKPHKY